jgi:hypothetical protein
MARKPSTLKSTTGSGFNFEDEVGAFFATSLLTGEPLQDREWGAVTGIEFQTPVSDWQFDDLLLTFDGGQRLAFSIKSNKQIKDSGYPSDFVTDAWEQYLKEHSTVFDPTTDYIGLVTIPITRSQETAITDLLEWSEKQSPTRFVRTVNTPRTGSTLKRAMIKSLECPPALASKHGISAQDVPVLIRHLRVRSFDFQSMPSHDVACAIRFCQQLLVSGARDEAEEVWSTLIRLVSEHRKTGGFLDRDRVLKVLVSKHKLKPWPQYRNDLLALRSFSDELRGSITDTIGYTKHLNRDDELHKLTGAVQRSSCVAVLGDSGSGKSALVKNWIDGLPTDTPLVWLWGDVLASQSPQQLRNSLQLSYPPDELGAATMQSQAYFVVDGAEAISSAEGYRNLAALVRALRVGSDNSPWHLVVTCQQEAWNRVLFDIREIIGTSTLFTSFTLVGVTDSQLDELCEEFPQLLPLRLQRDLRGLLTRPKILDVAAKLLTEEDGAEATKWVGESSLSNWFWEREIAKGPSAVVRSQALMSVAEQQADRLTPDVTISTLPPGVDELRVDRILVLHDDKVRLQHDLYGDWARLRIIRNNADDLVKFLQHKLLSPFWNRSVRLYGVYLLEQHKDTAPWKAAVDALGEATGGLGQDLLLEAVFFAANPAPLLEALWPHIAEENGNLLRRMLARFLFAATVPNQLYMSLADSPLDEVHQATIERLPYWPQWLPVIRILHQHQEEVIHLVPAEVAAITERWLRFVPTDWQYRREAAELAIALAHDLMAHEWEFRYAEDDLFKTAFKAVLAAINELPEQVSELALRAAGRTFRPDRHGRTSPHEEIDDSHIVRKFSIPRRPKEQVVPWPTGPIQEPNDEFREICLGSDGLRPVILKDPDLARELILSLLIRTPRVLDKEFDPLSIMSSGECEIGDFTRHYPPCYWHYPWLTYLAAHPLHAIATITQLVNFATERRVEAIGRSVTKWPGPVFELDGEQRTWLGDHQVYKWYTGLYGPHPVCSALMTLEYVLYNHIDAGEPVDELITAVISSSTSVAFAGLLAAVGAKQPELLRGPLQFLLASTEVLTWERERPIHVNTNTQMLAWTMRHEEDIKAAFEWHSMPHRKCDISTIAHQLFLTDQQTRDFFAEVVERWKAERDYFKSEGDDEAADHFERFISRFTPEHFSIKYSEEHKRYLITHQFPGELRAKSEIAIAQAQAGLERTVFPTKCRRILNGELPFEADTDSAAIIADCRRILEEPDTLFDGIVSKADVACGAAAVLLQKASTWLAQHPEENSWCRTTVTTTIEEPPDVKYPYDYADMPGLGWHSFCATALPILWAENLTSPKLRRCVALLALDRNYHTVGILSASCHSIRTQLGDDFLRVLALARHWARERISLQYREDMAHGGWVSRPEERRSFRVLYALPVAERAQFLSSEFPQTFEGFVSGTLSTAMPPLCAGALGHQRDYSQDRLFRRRHRRRFEVDVELIRAAYMHMPALGAAISREERSSWIETWRELLECLLQTLEPMSDEDVELEVEGSAYEFDRWVLGAVSVIITQMSEAEQPESLWRKVLDLGWQASQWVEHFLYAYFTNNLRTVHNPSQRTVFIRQWSAMIEYARTASGWKTGSRGSRYLCNANWQRLMGLKWFSVPPWRDEHASIIREMESYYALYVTEHLVGSEALANFIRLLRQPVGQLLRLPGLRWVERRIQIGGFGDERDQVVNEVSLLLVECWNKQREELRTRAAAFDSFKRLLRAAADQQNLIALELQHRLVSS